MGSSTRNRQKKAKTAPRRISWMGGLIFAVAGLVPLGLVGSFLCVYLPPGRFGLSTLLGLAFPWLILLSAAIGITYLFFFKKRCLIFFAAILLNFQNISLFIRMPRQHRPPDDLAAQTATRPSEFKVLSYNVCLFGFYASQKDRNQLKNRISTFLNVEEADILCLQEYYESKDARFRIREALQTGGYRYATKPQANARFYFGNVIFSRYPILRQDTVAGLSPLHALYADLLLPNQDTLRVYTFHLASLHFDENDKLLYNELLNRSFNDTVSYKAVAGKIARKVSAAARTHRDQIQSLKTHANACPYALLLCGDMNENPISYAYRQLSDGLHDAFVEQGSGLGRTYNGLFPAYRIDYIFFRPAPGGTWPQARYFEVGDVNYSDHKPVSAIMRF